MDETRLLNIVNTDDKEMSRSQLFNKVEPTQIEEASNKA